MEPGYLHPYTGPVVMSNMQAHIQLSLSTIRTGSMTDLFRVLLIMITLHDEVT
jgi:hypothetical protein